MCQDKELKAALDEMPSKCKEETTDDDPNKSQIAANLLHLVKQIEWNLNAKELTPILKSSSSSSSSLNKHIMISYN